MSDTSQGGGRRAIAEQVERQLATAQQITHIGSWEWSLGTNQVFWSDELYRIYGFEPRSRDISFEFFLSRLHEDDRERVRNAVTAALERGGRFQYIERIVRPDGSIRELDTVGEAVKDESQRVIGLIGTCRDVTEERLRDETIRLYADIVDNVQIGLTVWEGEHAASGADFQLRAFNAAAERSTGGALAAGIGRTLADVMPELTSTALPSLLVAVRDEGGVRDAPSLGFGDRIFAMKVFRLPGSKVGVAVEDVTVTVRAQQMQTAEQAIFEKIASDVPLEEIMHDLILAIEGQSTGAIGSVLLLDPDGVQMRHAAGPSLPDAYNRAIDGVAIGPMVGSCGTAAFRGEPVVVMDIDEDPLWASYRDLTRPHGLRACWSTPIVATGGGVLGTFAIYYRERRGPTDAEKQLLARATYVARIAIERRAQAEQLRALSGHIEWVREEERANLAREIHDELGQALTAIKLDLAWIGRRLSSDGDLDRASVLDKLRSSAAMTDEVVKLVRRIAAALRPGVLDDLGLRAAVEWQAEDFEKRTGTRCEVMSDVDDVRLDRDLSTNLFRILQEALTNVARHARATSVHVRLSADDHEMELEVSDDGRGISSTAASSSRSLGLLGIRERARRMGGRASITGEPQKGTRVLVTVPIEAPRSWEGT